jgi:hypothetical protein
MTERLWLISYSQRMTGQTQTYPAPVCQGGTSRALLQRLVLISPSCSSTSCLPSGGDLSLRRSIGVSSRTLTPAPARPTSVLESSPGSSVQGSSRAVCTACHRCRMADLRIGTNPDEVQERSALALMPIWWEPTRHRPPSRTSFYSCCCILATASLRPPPVGTDSPVTIAGAGGSFLWAEQVKPPNSAALCAFLAPALSCEIKLTEPSLR